jgi:hypothetical protein
LLTYLLGPFLAFFPKRWRAALARFLPLDWQRAAILSGILETVGALILLGKWYFYGLATWVDNGVGAAMEGKLGPHVITHDIAGAAYLVWITHPLTWAIGYFIVEGVVRLVAAAITEHAHGILPLYIVDAIFAKVFLPAPPKPDPDPVPGGTSSQTSTFRDKFLTAMAPKETDELRFGQAEDGETLAIHSSRIKPDWTPPRVVRYDDAYYRLEHFSRGVGSRPFVYSLRKLAAGVPGRNVLLYQPDEVLVREKS